jgi:hypothetical protein
MISEDVIEAPTEHAVDQSITKALSAAMFKWLSGGEGAESNACGLISPLNDLFRTTNSKG